MKKTKAHKKQLSPIGKHNLKVLSTAPKLKPQDKLKLKNPLT